MRLLYYDRWVEAPAPVPWPGCLTVRVLSACSPGEQAQVKAKLSVARQIQDKLMQSGRLLRGTVRHLST
jgi:hypothetical protein